MARKPGMRQVLQAKRAIERALAEYGLEVDIIDHRYCGEGLKILVGGLAYEVSEMAMLGKVPGLPKGTFLEPVNSEVLGLYYA